MRRIDAHPYDDYEVPQWVANESLAFGHHRCRYSAYPGARSQSCCGGENSRTSRTVAPCWS
jgi:hypothetical protein